MNVLKMITSAAVAYLLVCGAASANAADVTSTWSGFRIVV